MNKKLLTVLMAGSPLLVNTSAFAEDTGKVEFSGRIVADTLRIDADGAGANTVVTLLMLTRRILVPDGGNWPTKDFQIFG